MEVATQPAEAGAVADGLQTSFSRFPFQAPESDTELLGRMPGLSYRMAAHDPSAVCSLFGFNTCHGTAPEHVQPEMAELAFTTHTAAVRRTIRHPKEWSEFVLVISSGQAVSSIGLSDGRRQVLSILLPGDVVCATSLFEPVSGYSVEAITDVTYRRFRRADVKAMLSKNYLLFESLTKMWAEESGRADQLALDLGRRRADERVARFILNLAQRLAQRGMVRGQTFDFPLRQRHIADATGLTAVHVSKVLGEFQRLGVIRILDRSLTIVDESELRRVGAPH